MKEFAGGKIQACVGPRELGAADDLEEVIVDFIDGAKESLAIAVQELDSEAIAQAILDARFRHVSVRVFLEHSYLQTERTRAQIDDLVADPAKARAAQWEEPRPNAAFRTNRDILAALLRQRHRGPLRSQPEHLPSEVRAARLQARGSGAVATHRFD